ncbi:hypothetical protein OESDEN_03101 [Oesophagostomum dentatum]|uniref:Uncharacterized protein n=1 Tax=Oesophagostomum dentatum TaxID=61180 RepID=A0A0B1TM67_OESDE|nr:hypothetical protein OESDEN_03101 [Oesophagostomum dentatum]
MKTVTHAFLFFILTTLLVTVSAGILDTYLDLPICGMVCGGTFRALRKNIPGSMRFDMDRFEYGCDMGLNVAKKYECDQSLCDVLLDIDDNTRGWDIDAADVSRA